LKIQEPGFEQFLRREIVLILSKGAFYCFWLGQAAGAMLLLLEWVGLAQGFTLPAVWAMFCGAVALVLRQLLFWDRFFGPVHYFAFGLIVSLPSFLYLIAHFLTPHGALTYMTGPSSHLYYLLILLSGFMMNKRLSIGLGSLAGIEYFLFYLWDKDQLAVLQIADPLLHQDLTDPSVYLLKPMIMFFCGLLTGVVSARNLELLRKVLAEEREKTALDRLFGQYVSLPIKNKLIAEKRDLFAESKTVTVLFADLRSFTHLCEELEPAQLVGLLSRYFCVMVKGIGGSVGVVDKFIGDAVMAVFGGVLELRNPCASAFEAALKMRWGLAKLNKQLQMEGLPTLENGIGIHVGLAVQGTIGSAQRKEFTVIGDVVNLASRLEEMTKELGLPVLFSRDVYDQLTDDFRHGAQNFGTRKVKGRVKGIEVFGFGDPTDTT